MEVLCQQHTSRLCLLQVRNVKGFKQSSGHRWDFLPVFGITGIFFTLFDILHTGGSRGKVSAVFCCFQLSLPAVSQFQSNTHASARAWRQTAERWWFGWTRVHQSQPEWSQCAAALIGLLGNNVVMIKSNCRWLSVGWGHNHLNSTQAGQTKLRRSN